MMLGYLDKNGQWRSVRRDFSKDRRTRSLLRVVKVPKGSSRRRKVAINFANAIAKT
jgi:hypothetical protein